MKKAYICSPYHSDTEEGVKRNKAYARDLTRWAIKIGYAPICPHLYLTEVLDDENPAERADGLRCGLELLAACDVVIVGSVFGVSVGMQAEIREAVRLGLCLISNYLDV